MFILQPHVINNCKNYTQNDKNIGHFSLISKRKYLENQIIFFKKFGDKKTKMA
jgi:hypothetical protein